MTRQPEVVRHSILRRWAEGAKFRASLSLRGQREMFHRRRVISTTAANERITKTLLRSNGSIEAIKRVDRLPSLPLSLSVRLGSNGL